MDTLRSYEARKRYYRKKAIERIATERNINPSVAAHIYDCWSSEQQRNAREYEKQKEVKEKST